MSDGAGVHRRARIALRTGNPSERGALTRIAALQCGVGRHRHEGGCGVGDGDGQKRGRRRPGSAECGGGGGGCRGRGCRATCDAVTSANRPLLTLPAPSSPRYPLSLRPFRAAHEPHPRNRTRPPNYGLEFELAVNPFIALPPPPARHLPPPLNRLTTTPSSLAPHSATPQRGSAPLPTPTGLLYVGDTSRAVWVYNAPCGVGATCARCAHRSRPKARITRHFFPERHADSPAGGSGNCTLSREQVLGNQPLPLVLTQFHNQRKRVVNDKRKVIFKIVKKINRINIVKYQAQRHHKMLLF